MSNALRAGKKRRRRFEAIDIISWLFVTVFALMIVFPFYTAIVTSFTSSSSYAQNPVQLWPQEFTLSNYQFILQSSMLWTGYQNTLIITISGTLYAMAISVTMAYGLSFREYPGKKAVFIFVLITMYFSGGMMPTYLQIKNMGLINSRWSIILMYGVSPFNIIIIKNNIEHLPDGIMEAARIDGANEFRLFSSIVLPLIKTTIATFTLFVAVAYWNEWFWSTLTLTKTNLKTLQLVLRNIIDQTAGNYDNSAFSIIATGNFSQGVKVASVMCIMLPIMLFYPFLQKYFVKGILVGAIKM